MIEVVTHGGFFLVDTELTPRKWLERCPRTAAEDVVFLAFNACFDNGPTRAVVLRLGAIESVQDAR